MRLAPLLFLCVYLMTTSAFSQAVSEFNWVPSGNIDVGVLDSENDSDYRSTGDIITVNLPYADGTRPTSRAGRRTTKEVFTINVSRPRWGSQEQGNFAIRRR